MKNILFGSSEVEFFKNQIFLIIYIVVNALNYILLDIGRILSWLFNWFLTEKKTEFISASSISLQFYSVVKFV